MYAIDTFDTMPEQQAMKRMLPTQGSSWGPFGQNWIGTIRTARLCTWRAARWARSKLIYCVLTWLRGEVNPVPNRRYSHDYTSSRGLRQSIVQRVRDLDLQAPFTWEEYIRALQAEFARGHPPRHLEIRRAALPQGTSGQWVWIEQSDTHEHVQKLRKSQLDTHVPSIANRASGDSGATAGETAAVSAHLFLPQVVDESHLERIVYHELGHLELGHLQLHGRTPLPSIEMGIKTSTGIGSAFSCASLPADDPRERDAEAFATVLARLARGWDPAAIPAPRLDQFFDVLS